MATTTTLNMKELLAPLHQKETTDVPLLQCLDLVRVSDFSSSAPTVFGFPGHFDRFKIELRYATKHLIWEVLFSGHDKGMAPDFIFTDGFRPRIENLPSLATWNPTDPVCLRHLLLELKKEYFEYQGSLIKSIASDLIKYEYKTVMSGPLSSRVLVVVGDGKDMAAQTVVFSVRVGHPSISEPSLAKAFEEQPLQLLVTFGVQGSNTSVDARLVVPDSVVRKMGPLVAAPWPPGIYLREYINIVEKALELELKAYGENLVRRRQFVSSLISHFGSALLEYDEISFQTVSFLFENNGFAAVLNVNVAATHPEPLPSYTFASITMEKPSGLFERPAEFRGSPRWTSEKLATTVEEDLIAQLEAFKAECVRSNPQKN